MSCLPVSAQMPQSVAVAGSGAAWRANPAFAGLERLQLGLVREFSLPELTSSLAALTLGPASLVVRAMAFQGYSEHEAGLAVRFRGAGLTVVSGHARPDGFQPHRWLAWKAGLLQETRGVTLGVTAAPAMLAVGVLHNRHNWTLQADAVMESGSFSPRAGLRWLAGGRLRISAGMASNPNLLAAGLEVSAGAVGATFAASRHPDLGWTQAMGLSWR